MFKSPEQFSDATKALFSAQLAVVESLSKKAFEGAEKIIELNLSAAKTTIDESLVNAREMGAATDMQSLLSTAAAQAKPGAEQAAGYGRALSSLLSEQHAALVKAAEEQVAQSSRELDSLIDALGKNAPPGSENAIAALKAVIVNANAGYEQLARTSKQALEALQANLDAAAAQFAQAADKAAAPGRKK